MGSLFIVKKTFVQKKKYKETSDFCLALCISYHYQSRRICANTSGLLCWPFWAFPMNICRQWYNSLFFFFVCLFFFFMIVKPIKSLVALSNYIVCNNWYWYTPADILEQVLDDVENTEGMVNQVLYKSFTKKQVSNKALLPVGQEVLKTMICRGEVWIHHLISRGSLVWPTVRSRWNCIK